MSSAPFFKLWFSDFVGDTLHLKDAEVGNYFLILGAMWNAGGELDMDQDDLARIARCSPKVWGKRWARLARYFEVRDGKLTNPKLLKERQKVAEISAERSDAGKAGARAKALKNNKLAQANAKANGQAKRKQPEPPEEGRDLKVSLPSSVPDRPAGVPMARQPTGQKERAKWLSEMTVEERREALAGLNLLAKPKRRCGGG